MICGEKERIKLTSHIAEQSFSAGINKKFISYPSSTF
jgi:hypothetical protein